MSNQDPVDLMEAQSRAMRKSIAAALDASRRTLGAGGTHVEAHNLLWNALLGVYADLCVLEGVPTRDGIQDYRAFNEAREERYSEQL